MVHQKGLLSVDMLRTLVFLSLFVVLSLSLSSTLSNKIDALSIENHIDALTLEAQHHYAKQVLDSKCLAQPSIDPTELDIELMDKLGTYDIQYDHLAPATPHSLNVSFSFTELNTSAVARYLTPDSRDDTTFYYQRPLGYQRADFQHSDNATGCLQ